MFQHYNQCVRRPSYNFVAGAILLIIYEVLLALFPAYTINGVDALFQSFLRIIPFSTLIISVLLIVIGIYYIYTDKQEGFSLKSNILAFMYLESTIWAFIILFTVPMLVGKLLLQNIPLSSPCPPPGMNFFQKIALSCGAGFYEEFFFRFILVSGLQYLMGASGWSSRNFMIIIGSAIFFALAHYVGAYGDHFSMNSFLQRFLFGLIMNFLFVTRGFGIAASTHAIYDIIVLNLR